MSGKPRIDAPTAERIAADRFGLRGHARELPSYADRNFRIDTGDAVYVLKIANTTETVAQLEFQQELLERLARREPALRVPGIVTSRAGRGVERVSDATGRECACRVATWIEGRPLGDSPLRDAGLWRGLGSLVGRVARGLDGFDPPEAHRELVWDIKRVGALRSHLRELDGSRRREIAEWLFLQYDACVAPELDCLPHAVVHNDANDHNIVVTGETGAGAEPLGLIDFGDALWSIRIADPAIACAYAMLDEDRPLDTASEILRGYHEIRPLEESEVDLLFHLVRSRLLTSVCQSAHASGLEPDNEYIRVSEAPAWRLLERLVDIEPDAARRGFRRACGLEPPAPRVESREILELRRRHLGPSLSLSYESPLQIVRGRGAYLFDDGGSAYLDLVNNVCHVGHAHPTVVEAASRQMARLNTNTRYLHRQITEYARRLAATLPDPLEVCFFVNSGSEANELALRLARAATRGTDFLVLEGGYHGNTPSLIDLSQYKFDGPGGAGKPEHVHVAPLPDTYRGRFRENDPRAAERYVEELDRVLRAAIEIGRRVAGFLCESLPGCAGQIVPPPGYLAEAYRRVREAGALCIADEVQVGFGRVGSHFWGFAAQGACPDIVTLGKPIGNGHPLGAVVTTREIAGAFDNGMEYFNTFGGNPVSCATGLAVLDVIDCEGLQARAHEVGARLLRGLRGLQPLRPTLGDVRGMGLFLGIEMVEDPETREPAPARARAIVENLKARGFLLSTDGPRHNVIKIKPPLCLSTADVDLLLGALETL